MPSDRRSLLPLLPLLPLAAGCGDPLASRGDLGEPLARIEGDVWLEPESEGAYDSARLRVSMFWSSASGGRERAEQQAWVETAFPARHQLTTLTPPPPGSVGADGVALGIPMLYEDADGDHRWDSGSEAVIGGSSDGVLLYAEHAPEEWAVGDQHSLDTGSGFGVGELEEASVEAGFHRAISAPGACEDTLGIGGGEAPGRTMMDAPAPMLRARVTLLADRRGTPAPQETQ